MNFKERQEIIAKSPISFKYLKRFNAAAFVLHLIQGILMLVLGTQLEWERSLYTFYTKFTIIEGPPFRIDVTPDPQVLVTIGYLGVIVASFPLLSALAHFIIAFIKNDKYNENLKKGMNPYRWYEYAFSSSIMIVLIALFLGRMGFLVFDNDLRIKRNDDNVRILNGTDKPKNRKNKLDFFHTRMYFRWTPMGRTLRILHWSTFFNKRRNTHLCLHDSFHILHCLQHLCP